MNARHAFAGFEDWIEVFRGGEQTDSAGNTRIWSEADLDSVVGNFSADDPPPAVVGHPKTDAPAYGWVSALKRDGLRLLAKFADVEPAFEALVKERRFRKRSIALDAAGAGYRLRHVGWLGAAAPAIAGLKDVSFSAPPAHEFVADWRTPSILARMQRRMREFLVEQFGVEAADRVLPDWDIEALAEIAREPDETTPDAAPPAPYSAPEDSTMPEGQTYTAEQIEEARRQAREAAEATFAKERAERDKAHADELAKARAALRRAEFTAEVSAAIDAGTPPAVLEGAAEFMLSLPEAGGEFEFSRGAGDKAETVKTEPLAWFREHLKGLAGIVPMGERAGAASDPGKRPTEGDDAEIARRARAYRHRQAESGVNISFAAAVAAVEKNQDQEGRAHA